MRYRVRHRTEYRYGEPVSMSYNLVLDHPRPTPGQTVRDVRLRIDPPPASEWRRRDYFGNRMTFFSIVEGHEQLEVVLRFEAEVEPAPDVDPARSPPWETVRDHLGLHACQFAYDSVYVRRAPRLREYAETSFLPGRPILEAAMELSQRIHQEFQFDATATDVATPLEEVLAKRKGVCQDFAHLQLGCLRSLGLAGRYVSGYILTYAPPGKPKLVGADASHAWVSLYCGQELDWIGLDPTNDILVSEQHVTMAWGRDYDDVSPIRGVVLGGGEQVVTVGVDVEPLP